MGHYGLLIPRSYNDYYSKSDPQDLRKAVADMADDTININSTNPIQNKAVAEIVPAAASPENKLADKNFVNSSIATNTAVYRGHFDTLADLEAYAGEKTNNDYAFVSAVDEIGNARDARYKWNGSAWVFEYYLNNSSFTADQWGAINSGITEELVEQIGGGSALVPSMTLEEYEALSEEEKHNGQIREITDAPQFPVPFATVNDNITTAANVWTAAKTKNEINGLFEIGSNENGNYFKCVNGLLICWGKTTVQNTEVTLPAVYRDSDYSISITVNRNVGAPSAEGNPNGYAINNNTMYIFSNTGGRGTNWQTIGFWK
ncbi:MAG: hypothetical protein MJ168_10935 [Clostridia bacterium]|nr:hypothetical protein [Clostridia bacterium]